MSFNLDLSNHAADKVKRALDDVLQLTDDPGERLMIAVMAASVPIGAAAGILAAQSAAHGVVTTKATAASRILDLLKIGAFDGPQAVVDSLKGAAHGK